MADYEIPSGPGVYTLIIKLTHEEVIIIGRFGSHSFPRGFYTYAGSALGKGGLSLRGRLLRHLSSEKKRRWHIDYLLDSKNVEIVAVIYSETRSRIECPISKNIEDLEDAVSLVKGFGASDCRNGCQSHLHYFPNTGLKRLIKYIYEIHEELGLSPRILLRKD